MSRVIKSQVDDLTKLRRILDDSSDPSLNYLLSKDDKTLDSIRRRLNGDLWETQPQTHRFFHSSESLEPRVSIRAMTPVSPRLVTLPPKIEPSMLLSKFEPVSPSTQTPSIPPLEFSFADEELFEVEKIDISIPEFVEVIPEEMLHEHPEKILANHDRETSLHESNLSEWQPIEEEQRAESPEPQEKQNGEDVPEFERVDISLTSDEERPIESDDLPKKDELIGSPVDFIPTESLEPSFQKLSLSKRDERAAKKAQRKKEREVKRQEKIELKRLKKEKQEKDRPQEENLTIHDEETSLPESDLPEWLPIEEEQEAKSLEEPIEPPVDFIPTESLEPSFQKLSLSKRDERAAKKAQRKKEREVKRQEKIELKRLKKEKQEKEQEAKQTAEEQQHLPQLQEEQPTRIESIEVTETPQIQVDYNNFKGIESINEKIAELLYKNGFFSVENIKDATIDDLVQIRGIKRKLAKQIKKEIEQQLTDTDTFEFIPVKQKITKKKEKKKLEDSGEWESSPLKKKIQKSSSHRVCTYKNYTLYKRETRKQDGKRSTIHYFAKGKSEKGQPAPLPKGYQIAINKKTRVPYLKKK